MHALQRPDPDQLGLTIHCGQSDRRNPPCNEYHHPTFAASRSRHPGGGHVALADGSVRFVRNPIDFETWRALSSPDGNEVVSADSYQVARAHAGWLTAEGRGPLVEK